mgnify:CR=1 FL=1
MLPVLGNKNLEWFLVSLTTLTCKFDHHLHRLGGSFLHLWEKHVKLSWPLIVLGSFPSLFTLIGHTCWFDYFFFDCDFDFWRLFHDFFLLEIDTICHVYYMSNLYFTFSDLVLKRGVWYDAVARGARLGKFLVEVGGIFFQSGGWFFSERAEMGEDFFRASAEVDLGNIFSDLLEYLIR